MVRMARGSRFSSVLLLLLLLWSPPSSFAGVALQPEEPGCPVPVVPMENRKTIASCDSGTISSVDIYDGYSESYHLQFFTLEPQSLLLPLLLHTDMVFYVHTGRGTVSWVDEDQTHDLEVESGDIYRIGSGSVVYMRSHPDPMRVKLRVYAIFSTSTSSDQVTPETCIRAYSNLNDLVRGFDEQVLQMGFTVSEAVIAGLKRVEKPLPIVPFPSKHETTDNPTWKEGIFEALIGGGRPFGPENSHKNKDKKEKKTKTFNILNAKPDVENCNGRSIAVNDKDFHALKGSNIGVFMVNLTKGSMMVPHWNPLATEIAIGTHGEGMVQVVLPSTSASPEGASKCKSLRFKVSEGVVFLVQRYHPMAQMSFNNDSLTFVGFSTRAKKNHPQFLAGNSSVLHTLNKEILALSLGIYNTTVDQLLAPQEDSIMVECTSCAEEEEKKMEAEIERHKQEEEAKRREEEEAAKRREEEEEAKKREEEEEARRREEEEAKRREEEEEAKKREEDEEARRREEEEAAKRRDEEAKRREEEQRRQQEEEARRQEEEKQREKEQEEKDRRQQEEEEEEMKRQEEQEGTRRQEEEEARRHRQAEEEEAREREGTEEEGGGGGGGGSGREIFKLRRVWVV